MESPVFSIVVLAVVAVIVLTGIGIVASSVVRTLRVHADDDPLVRDVLAVLPGGNCGACGNATCFIAATEIARGRQPASICATGGAATAATVASVLRAHTGNQVG
jgi:Na+-translocating ferredoxin:NAD+ oxidoreductase RNF subunit RnfB